jgi:hypothetical protein
LCQYVVQSPEFVFSADPENLAGHMAKVIGEAYDDKFFNDENKKLMTYAVRYMMDQAPESMRNAFKNACQNVLSAEHRNRIEQAYGAAV